MTSKEEFWIAKVSGRTSGFMILAPNDDGSLEVDWLNVHLDFQSIGIGTFLIEKAAGMARARKMQVLNVHTWKINKEMVNFAFKNCFEVFERIKDFGEGKDALHRKNKLPP